VYLHMGAVVVLFVDHRPRMNERITSSIASQEYE
jgi:hypothetical protein